MIGIEGSIALEKKSDHRWGNVDPENDPLQINTYSFATEYYFQPPRDVHL